jgi:hypothetical protein
VFHRSFPFCGRGEDGATPGHRLMPNDITLDGRHEFRIMKFILYYEILGKEPATVKVGRR